MRRTITACGLVGALTFMLLPDTVGTIRLSGDRDIQAREFGPWLVAVNLGPIVNSGFAESGVAISHDGLSFYFQSAGHAAADLDLFVSRRAAIDLPWGAPATLGAMVNSSAPDVAPSLTRDGHYLFFASIRSGNFDIYVSHRPDPTDDFGWEPPVALPSPVNGPSFDAGPTLFERPGDRTQLYFVSDRANGRGQAGLDIYVSELEKDGGWSPPTSVGELNSAAQDNRPAIRFDGLEMLLTSSRDGNLDLYSAHRTNTSEPWSTPERLGLPVNTPSLDTQASLSANGRTLYFASDRPGGSGSLDVYASTRVLRRNPE